MENIQVLEPVNIVESGIGIKRYCHNTKKCDIKIPCDTGDGRCSYLKNYPIFKNK